MNKTIFVSRSFEIPATTRVLTIRFFQPFIIGSNQSHRCEYQIALGDEVIRENDVMGVDGVQAVLTAMRLAMLDLEYRFRDVYEQIPSTYLADMMALKALDP